MSLTYEFSAKDIVEENRVKISQIEEIKLWRKTTKLPQLLDEQIVAFLISCDNDADLTKVTILAYFKYKSMSPDMFAARTTTSEELRSMANVIENAVIPIRTKENCLVMLQRLKNTSYWAFHLDIAAKYLFMTLDTYLRKYPPNGLIIFFDMKGVGLMHMTRLRVGVMRRFFHYVQEGLPVKLKAIHMLNTVYFIDKLISLVKPFMKKELFELIHFHQCNMNMDDFFRNYLSADYMPSDYGGKQPSMAELSETTWRDLEGANEYFAAEEVQWQQYNPNK